jgi:alpha-mannosidase
MSSKSLGKRVLRGIGRMFTGSDRRSRRRKASAALRGPELLETRVMLSLPGSATDKTLYVVADAHLDTQWRWTIQDTINSYIKNTLDTNLAYFDAKNPDGTAKYPAYEFNFEGAIRYMLAKEYYDEPTADRWNRLLSYVQQGRWNVAGSSIDAGDVNIPSPESLMRQILYGNGYFQKTFGKTSTDIFLPDCFGFGYALPTVAAHMGLNGFSTQKLSWGSAYGTPFNVGRWQGPDGSTIFAALNPGGYGSTINSDLSANVPDSNGTNWNSRIATDGTNTGIYADYMYYGTGDQGGGPTSGSVGYLQTSVNNSPNATTGMTVVSATTDQFFRDLAALSPAQVAGLPVWNNELVMSTHGTGSYTSQAMMKRWNRQNEQLADAAERASVLADWLGAAAYPQQKLTDAWTRFLWHQFHDDLTGTSIPSAYNFSWNDEIIAQNQFAAVLSNAVGGVVRAMDTRGSGQSVVVYNPLAFQRQDVVEATLAYPSGTPSFVRVFDPQGNEVPSSIESNDGQTLKVKFLAQVPSVGLSVFDVRPASSPSQQTGLSAQWTGTKWVLQNERYAVEIDADGLNNNDGDVTRIYDKLNGREMLTSGGRLQLQMLYDESNSWPAWEVQYANVTAAPSEYVDGPAQFRIVNNGPDQVCLQITRTKNGSTFVQEISLSKGGQSVDFDTYINWQTQQRLLKASFPLAVSNAQATYDLGLGTIRRGNDTSTLYEVPAQQWADITATDDSYGVSVLNDSKYGWDKPNDNTLRLTLLHTPKCTSYTDQATLDLGEHRMRYSLYGHAGSWTNGAVDAAAELNQPLVAFTVPQHAGSLGTSYSFLSVSDPRVQIEAVKKAENSNETIIRVVEAAGADGVTADITLGQGIASAREVNGSEQPLGAATLVDGKLRVTLNHYQPRTFAVTLAAAPVALTAPTSQSISLPYNLDVVSTDTNRSDGSYDASGHSIPAELFPAAVTSEDVAFQMGPKTDGQLNAVSSAGQTITLSAPSSTKLYFLAAATSGAKSATFTLNTPGGPVATTLTVQGINDTVGRWGRTGYASGVIVTDEVGWVGTHRHSPTQNDAYIFCDLFKYELAVPAGTTSITLPNDSTILVFAMSLSADPNADSVAAQPLYDRLPLSFAALPPAPQAAADAVEMDGNSSLLIDALANDSDPGGHYPLALAAAGAPAHGTAVIENGKIRYTPNLNYFGADSFSYSIINSMNDMGSGTITVKIDPVAIVPTPPVAVNDTVLVGKNQPASLYVLTNDYDPDGDAPNIVSVTAPAHGTTAFADNRIIYTPANGYVGGDSFFYTIDDAVGYQSTASVAVTVTQIVPGLDYQSYQGTWTALPDFNSLAPFAASAANNFDISVRPSSTLFGLRFQGQIQIDTVGGYTFYTNSDDGSRLYIDGSLIVDNDGVHAAAEKSGAITLAPGLHSIRLDYFQYSTTSMVLEVRWAGPSLPKQLVPNDHLFRTQQSPFDTTSDFGTLTAQGQNGTTEGAAKAIDNNTGTKWLDFANSYPSTRASWLQYAYSNGKRYMVNSYTLTSANDAPERDPYTWRLLGSNDGGTTWTTLDTRTGVVFSSRLEKRAFSIASPALFNVYRLAIDRVDDPTTANSVQLAEWELLDSPQSLPLTVTGVSTTAANGSYTAGQVISIAVAFSGPVTVTGTPQLSLETGSVDHGASYSSGSGSAVLTFTYTVQAGDVTSHLDYASNTALALNGGTIRDAAGKDALLTLPSPGLAGSIGFSKNLVIDQLYDTTSDLGTITAQGENTGSSEGAAQAIDNSTTTKWLDFANANPSTRASWLQYQYAGGKRYIISSYTLTSANDFPARDPYNWRLRGSNDGGTTWTTLDTRSGVVFASRYQKQTFSIASPAPYNVYRLAIDQVDDPTTANSVQLAEWELIGSPQPVTVAGVSSPLANGAYKAGTVVPVTVTFSEPVTVLGTPQLTLETGGVDRTARYGGTYIGGSGTAMLTFVYTVQAGDTSSDLDYLSSTALALNGGTLRDLAGNDARLTLPSPGAAGSLAASKSLVIDTASPTSAVAALPGNSAAKDFAVAWSGSDGAAGSGIASYSIFVSIDNGSYVPWLTGTTITESVYHGQSGHSYAFYSLAADNADNVEPAPAAPDAQTAVLLGSPAIWSGGGNDNHWTTAVNWGGTPAVAQDQLHFGGSTGLANYNDFIAGTPFGGFTFEASAGPFFLDGNAVSLGGGIANNSASTQTINLPLLLVGGNAAISVSAGVLRLTGDIGETGGHYGINKTGAGTLVLSGSNSFTAGAVVTDGKLVVSSPAALLDGSDLTVGSSAPWVFAPSMVSDMVKDASESAVRASLVASTGPATAPLVVASPTTRTTPPTGAAAVDAVLLQSRSQRAVATAIAQEHAGDLAKRAARALFSWSGNQDRTKDPTIRAVDLVLARYGV